jgi:hypothetical protein
MPHPFAKDWRQLTEAEKAAWYFEVDRLRQERTPPKLPLLTSYVDTSRMDKARDLMLRTIKALEAI